MDESKPHFRILAGRLYSVLCGCQYRLLGLFIARLESRQAGRQAFIMKFWLNDSIDRLSGRAGPGHHISWIRFSWVMVPSERRRLLAKLSVAIIISIIILIRYQSGKAPDGVWGKPIMSLLGDCGLGWAGLAILACVLLLWLLSS